MSAAAAIATPEKATTYIARRSELVLVRKPQRHVRNPSDGTVIDITDPDRLQFRNGILSTDDPDTIAWLENHRLFGSIDDGFVRQQMPAPEPTDEELDAIMQVATDRLELTRILQVETEGYNRDKIVNLVVGQIRRLEAAEKAAAEAKGK